MKKKISALTIVAAMVVSMMVSCNVATGGSDNGSSANVGSVDNESSADTGDDSASNALFSFRITIDGNDYTLPCAVSDFKANGWEISGEDGSIKPNTKLLNGKIKKDNLQLYVQLYNSTSETINYSDCAVTQVSVNLSDCSSITLPGDFVFDEKTTVDDVIAKYGEPTEKDDYDSSYVLTYKKDVYQSVSFRIYKSESSTSSTYNNVTIENMGDR